MNLYVPTGNEHIKKMVINALKRVEAMDAIDDGQDPHLDSHCRTIIIALVSGIESMLNGHDYSPIYDAIVMLNQMHERLRVQ